MFLRELNKNESISFLQLVNEVANIDEVFAKEEKNLIEDYKKELGLVNFEIKRTSYEEIMNELKKSTYRNKLIIYFKYSYF